MYMYQTVCCSEPSANGISSLRANQTMPMCKAHTKLFNSIIKIYVNYVMNFKNVHYCRKKQQSYLMKTREGNIHPQRHRL